MKIIKLVIFLNLLLFLNSCDFSDNRLQFYNRSSTIVSVSTSVYYSDFIVNNIDFYLRDSICRGQTRVFGEPSGWHKDGWLINIRNSKDKKLKIHVFKLDTLRKYKNVYTINQIVKHKLLDTILSYTEPELDSMKWKIYYYGNVIAKNH